MRQDRSLDISRNEIVYLIHYQPKATLFPEQLGNLVAIITLKTIVFFDRCLKALTQSKYLFSRLPFPIEQVKLSRPVPLAPIRHCSIHGFVTCSQGGYFDCLDDKHVSHVDLIANFSHVVLAYNTAGFTRLALLLINDKVTVLDLEKTYETNVDAYSRAGMCEDTSIIIEYRCKNSIQDVS
jgi:hypothetical protein